MSDISRFYGTLYTHAIPWALHKKSWCKKNLTKTVYKQTLGNRLDIAIRKGQSNQSVGIPVGPDTSRIISEIVAVSIDSAIQQRFQLSKGQAFRQIDDWFIGFDSGGDAEKAIATLSEVCQEFEIELNNEKTRIFHAASSGESVWPEELIRFSFESRSSRQKQSLDHYFAKSFRYAHQFPDQNVLDFAIKRTRSIGIREDNWPLYEMYLLKAGRSNPVVILSIVQIFASYRKDGYPIGEQRIKKFIRDIVVKNAPLAHHAEVAWALFLAKVLRLNLPRDAAGVVARLNNSVCALLTLDLESRGLITGGLNKQLWKRSMSSMGLMSNTWLLSYEADLKGWLRGSASGYVEGNPYFGELKSRNISFYDTKRNVTHIRRTVPWRHKGFAKRPGPVLRPDLLGSMVSLP